MLNPWNGLKSFVNRLRRQLGEPATQGRGRRGPAPFRRSRLWLEQLETRETPSITPFSGGVLSTYVSNNVTEYSPDYTHVAGGGQSEWADLGRTGTLQMM